jgi:hypothetical protein
MMHMPAMIPNITAAVPCINFKKYGTTIATAMTNLTILSNVPMLKFIFSHAVCVYSQPQIAIGFPHVGQTLAFFFVFFAFFFFAMTGLL